MSLPRRLAGAVAAAALLVPAGVASTAASARVPVSAGTAASAPVPVSVSTPAPAAPVSAAQATALGEQAYLYGFPLLEFLRVLKTETSVRCPDSHGNAPLNSFDTATRFPPPSDRVVVAPNVDTLYSIAHLDLGRGPVVLSHPDMGHRYFVFELLDPYTNVIGYVGSRTTGSEAGRFAVTWTGHPGHRSAGARVIRSRYRYVWVIGRTLVNGASDRVRALALMRRYALTGLGGRRHFPAGCRPGQPRQAMTPSGLPFLTALNRALIDNPPPARDHPLLAKLAQLGVGPGLSVAGAHLAPAVQSALIGGVDLAASALPTIAKNTILSEAKANHGWANPASDIGAYGTDYRFRAGVAAIGLGANTRAEAVYPTALTDSAGRLLNGGSPCRAEPGCGLAPGTRYRIVFKPGQGPPNRAFWSLTMYNATGYLVANPINRYAVGSSHPRLRREPDGSIVVDMQRTRPTDPHVNWLPTPGGGFRLNLRIYWPRLSVLDGRWQPPPVQRLAP